MSDQPVREVPVAIVGGGPVGLVLALLLDLYGIDCVVLNAAPTTRWHPKGSTHNARTMEHYRRLGLSEAIRQIGLPQDHPTDVAYFTRYGSFELARCRMPTSAEKLRTVAASAVTDQVPEPIHRGNQMYVERFLFDHAATRPHVALAFGRTVTAIADEVSHVTLATTGADGAEVTYRARYAVGCDGGRSFVRKVLGIRYGGFDRLEQAFLGGAMMSSYVRAPTLYRDYLGSRRAWHSWALNPDVRSILTALNGADEFLVMTKATGNPADVGPGQVIAQIRAATGDPALPVEIISQEPWTAGAALVAESFGRGRVLLAGDAVHLFTPTGGFGMNTGIDDAANLSWKLAAAVNGWGGAGLLATYEQERRPIALRNTHAARELAKSVGAVDLPAGVEDDTPDGAAARRELGALLDSFGEEYASLGTQLGARYDDSPIVVRDAAPPPDDLLAYTPSSIPGGRSPHVWLDSGRGRGSSLFDRLGPGFTLLTFVDGGAAAARMQVAAERKGIPLARLQVAHPEAHALYGVDHVLVRPDQHIAWRGDRLPADVDGLLDRVCGAPEANVHPARQSDLLSLT